MVLKSLRKESGDRSRILPPRSIQDVHGTIDLLVGWQVTGIVVGDLGDHQVGPCVFFVVVVFYVCGLSHPASLKMIWVFF